MQAEPHLSLVRQCRASPTPTRRKWPLLVCGAIFSIDRELSRIASRVLWWNERVCNLSLGGLRSRRSCVHRGRFVTQF